MAPKTSEQALHDILDALNEVLGGSQAAVTLTRAWKKVSGAHYGSAGFARFHAETVSLLCEITEGIDALPPEERERYRRYVPAWWKAVTQPEENWEGGLKTVIARGDLDMLWALGRDRHMSDRFVETPREDRVELLTSAVRYLREQVQATPDLTPPVRDEIVSSLDHVLWLLGKVDTFGEQHAVRAVERVLGKTLSRATSNRQPGSVPLVVSLLVALSIAQSATTSVAAIVGNVRSIFGVEASAPEGAGSEADIVQSTVVNIYESCRPAALPPGSDATSADDNTVDAEVVED